MSSRQDRIHGSAPVDDHFWGIVAGLIVGLIIDFLFQFKTDGFFTFVGIVCGGLGAWNFIPKRKNNR